MKRKEYDPFKNRIITTLLLIVWFVLCIFILDKIDLTRIIFRDNVKKGPEEVKLMSKEQSDEIIKLAQKQMQDAEQPNENAITIGEIIKQDLKERKHGSQTTPIYIYNNQVIVPVTLFNNGKFIDCKLVLDTGATKTTVPESIANRLNISQSQTTQATSTVADGRRLNSTNANINGIRVGTSVIQNIDINIIPTEKINDDFDGLLGMNFLSNFNYKIDTKNRIIQWK